MAPDGPSRERSRGGPVASPAAAAPRGALGADPFADRCRAVADAADAVARGAGVGTLGPVADALDEVLAGRLPGAPTPGAARAEPWDEGLRDEVGDLVAAVCAAGLGVADRARLARHLAARLREAADAVPGEPGPATDRGARARTGA